jgi:hypothetical protein
VDGGRAYTSSWAVVMSSVVDREPASGELSFG